MQAGRKTVMSTLMTKIPAASLQHLKVTKAAPPARDQMF